MAVSLHLMQHLRQLADFFATLEKVNCMHVPFLKKCSKSLWQESICIASRCLQSISLEYTIKWNNYFVISTHERVATNLATMSLTSFERRQEKRQ